jgi:predicted peptidase
MVFYFINQKIRASVALIHETTKSSVYCLMSTIHFFPIFAIHFFNMKTFISITLVSFLPIFAFCQLTAVKGEAAYPFWINLPADSILNSKPPVLVFLHGKSLSGTDLERVRRYGVIHEIDKGRKIPAIVVAPQVATGSWDPDKVLTVLEYVQKTYITDSSRIYVVGMSLGGYGTLHFAGKYADKITAAVALCGGGNPKDAARLATIPLWIQHGDKDSAVPISESEKMVDAIKAVDESKLIYTIHQGADHGALERIFRTDEMYDWLFQQVRVID